VTGTRPWEGENKHNTKNGRTHAANYISWDGATDLCARISKKDGRTYRLPTEAEWEYACRAGSTTVYYFGDSSANLGDYAWYSGNQEGSYAHVVARLLPNDFGLYDMHGNVYEWCNDRYNTNYYSSSPSVDPTGPETGDGRVVRGGIVGYDAEGQRSARRNGHTPERVEDYLGFRLAR